MVFPQWYGIQDVSQRNKLTKHERRRKERNRKNKIAHSMPSTTLSCTLPFPIKGRAKPETIWAIFTPKIFNPCIPRWWLSLCPLHYAHCRLAAWILAVSSNHALTILQALSIRTPLTAHPTPTNLVTRSRNIIFLNGISLSYTSNNPGTTFYCTTQELRMNISELEKRSAVPCMCLQHPVRKGSPPPRVSGGRITATKWAQTHERNRTFLQQSP